jgi:hypothetical protein
VSEALSPKKSDRGNSTSSSITLDNAKDNWSQKAEESTQDAVLVIRVGGTVENIPCSRAALKNLTFSFIIDSCKDKVEDGLHCSFSLTESGGRGKHGGLGLELVVKPLRGLDKDELEMATRFVRAWALLAIQPTPCKVSAFLASPEGLYILNKSCATLADKEAGQSSDDLEKHWEQSKSLFSASDLDHMLAEEAAKVCNKLCSYLDLTVLIVS